MIATSATTFSLVTKEGSAELVEITCVVSNGLPMLILPNSLTDCTNEIPRCLETLHLSLPSKRIELTNCPKAKLSNGSRLPLGLLMAVLAAIGAIPADQVEHTIFDAWVHRGQLMRSDIDPIQAAVIAAENDLTLWCAGEFEALAGVVRNAQVFAARHLTDIVDHCLGRHLVCPAHTRVSSIEYLSTLTALKELRTFGTGIDAKPIFEIGGVTCTFKNGQIFALHLDQHDVL